jgi:hypothetical protein
MEIAMAEQRPSRPQPYPAEKARGGEIILRKPWQRAVFMAGLAGIFALLLFLALYAAAVAAA